MTPEQHEAAQAAAHMVPCPIDLCGAEIDEPCVSLRTGDALVWLPAHDARLAAAAEVSRADG